MAQFDLPLDELRAYRATHEAPADFDDFWLTTLAAAREKGWETRVEPVDNGLAIVASSDVTFAGFAGDPIRAWWHRPADREPIGVVVEFLGYSGGRGLPHQQGTWPLAGYAHLLVDSRGQGYGQQWPGATADPHGSGGSAAPGQMTRGIEDPETYYYRRLYTDAALALDVARGLAGTGVPLFVAGISQGGGLTIAAAALDALAGRGAIAGALPDVPFLCDFPRATTLVAIHPYGEIVTYLAAFRDRVDQTFRTLSYFDGVHLAARAQAPALFSAALMDEVCPPSTVFGAYNAWPSDDKAIEVYPFNGHEGGGVYHRAAQLEWLRARVG
ncbi:acetylxylan esterase [Microbacterium sediminis]|uniref:Acetylxylan esterase n=1 Tax=Microbacterium sediminis TaxID=904291 RepID=A0A1B9NDW6_9MICO|nr:acetylxylan esterase [Microbacterium sediminis]OCG74792.1 acetylxylan esterase [Microbacterium sediminis]QBR75095.1 acetylxylan esterase [Microbacterium sediminis]